MKHAAVKISEPGKVASRAQFESSEKTLKVLSPKSSQTAKDETAKIENIPIARGSENKSSKKKSAVSVIIAFPESEIVKSGSSSVEKVERKKTAAVRASGKIGAKKTQLADSALEKQEKNVSVTIKKQQSQTEITSPAKIVAESDLKKEKVVSVAASKKKKAEKKSEVLAGEKTEAKISKKNTFFSINKIKVIEKKIDPASERTDGKAEENVKSAVSISESAAIETNAAAKVEARKTKPKKNKPIGPAVFRGRKARYDFQVYALDTEFIDVPAIYIISRRKTDWHKRAHHNLICIGQTDSVLNEIKKHKNKCIKKHKANVISILPEESEKKRLRIEEDLRAAHAIVCSLE